MLSVTESFSIVAAQIFGAEDRGPLEEEVQTIETDEDAFAAIAELNALMMGG